jgi:hypothetical protein
MKYRSCIFACHKPIYINVPKIEKMRQRTKPCKVSFWQSSVPQLWEKLCDINLVF